MTPETFLTITNTHTETLREQGSKFLAFAYPVGDETEIEQRLDELKSKFPDATHHCYAWRLNPGNLKEFAQDDGEPSATAGLPILNELRSAGLCNVLVIVVRYFGGTKLGKSGLIQAYGQSAGDVLRDIPTKKMIPGKKFTVRLDYTQKKNVDHVISGFNTVQADAKYVEDITYELNLPSSEASKFVEEIKKLEYLGIEIESWGDVIIYV